MRRRKLLFAFQPVDAFEPGKKVTGHCQVSINGGKVKPIKNRSGFYCVTDNPPGEYSVTINNKYYCDKIVTIDTNELDPALPAFDVELEPNLLYAFSKGTTLLRGRVFDENNESMVDATAEVQAISKSFVTDSLGRFVFYFKNLEEDDEIEVILKKPGYADKNTNVAINKGEVNRFETALEPE